MKRIALLTLTCLLSLSNFAQDKFGYIDSQEISAILPEVKTAQEDLRIFVRNLETQISGMDNEYRQLLQEYQNNIDSYDDLTKQDKEAELMGFQQRMQTFQQNAEQEVQVQQQKLLKPIEEKIKKAIDDVAMEGNYTYIFERAGGLVLYAKESENILEKVKKKLNL